MEDNKTNRWRSPFELGLPLKKMVYQRLALGGVLTTTFCLILQILPTAMGWSHNNRDSGLLFVFGAWAFFLQANRDLFPHHPSKMLRAILRWVFALAMTLLWSGFTFAVALGVETAIYYLS